MIDKTLIKKKQIKRYRNKYVFKELSIQCLIVQTTEGGHSSGQYMVICSPQHQTYPVHLVTFGL